jgi:5-(carboxyamino)imidazole ribonucleotide mutase
MTAPADVRILMGSDSDLEHLQDAVSTLKEFGVSHDVRVLSAHRTPAELAAYLEQANREGAKVFIGAAGGAAHLAGVIAAHTTKPVLAVPIPSALNGLDSLLAMVQMPGGVPVATFAIGKPGAMNAALFAVQILAQSDARLAKALEDHRKGMARKVAAKDEALQKKLRS